MKSNQGFTLLEVLAAIVILSVLITAVVAPLGQMLKSTGRSTQTLQVTTQAQNVLEFVRGQWKAYPRVLNDSLPSTDVDYKQDQNRTARTESRRRYDSNCYDSTGLSVPSGITYSIVVKSVDRNGASGSTLTLNGTCTGATAVALPPLMKQVTVTVTGPNNRRSILSANVARP